MAWRAAASRAPRLHRTSPDLVFDAWTRSATPALCPATSKRRWPWRPGQPEPRCSDRRRPGAAQLRRSLRDDEICAIPGELQILKLGQARRQRAAAAAAQPPGSSLPSAQELSASVEKGRAIFYGPAGCLGCHGALGLLNGVKPVRRWQRIARRAAIQIPGPMPEVHPSARSRGPARVIASRLPNADLSRHHAPDDIPRLRQADLDVLVRVSPHAARGAGDQRRDRQTDWGSCESAYSPTITPINPAFAGRRSGERVCAVRRGQRILATATVAGTGLEPGSPVFCQHRPLPDATRAPDGAGCSRGHDAGLGQERPRSDPSDQQLRSDRGLRGRLGGRVLSSSGQNGDGAARSCTVPGCCSPPPHPGRWWTGRAFPYATASLNGKDPPRLGAIRGRAFGSFVTPLLGKELEKGYNCANTHKIKRKGSSHVKPVPFPASTVHSDLMHAMASS